MTAPKNPKVVGSPFNADTLDFNQEDALGSSGSGTVNIDWTVAQKQAITLTGTPTFTFTAPPGPTTVQLRLTQDGTGGRTVTWPAILWVSKTAPTLSPAANAVDIVSLFWNGTSYYGTYSQNFG